MTVGAILKRVFQPLEMLFSAGSEEKDKSTDSKNEMAVCWLKANNPKLAEKIAKSYGKKLGDVKLSVFSDGEFQVSYEETIRGNEVFIIQSTIPPLENFFELLLMIDAAKRASAKRIIAVIPYFGFARQDRKDKPCFYNPLCGANGPGLLRNPS